MAYGQLKLANNAAGTLASAISSSDTTMTVTAAAPVFPTFDLGDGHATVTVFDPDVPDVLEIMQVSEIAAGSPLTFSVERSGEGTLARAWPAGSRVEMRATAGVLQEIIDGSLAVYRDWAGSSPAMFTESTHGGYSISGTGPNYTTDHDGLNGGILLGSTIHRAALKSWHIAGAPVAPVISGPDAGGMFSCAVESVGTSIPFELGAPPAFAPSTGYVAGTIVQNAGVWYRLLSAFASGIQAPIFTSGGDSSELTAGEDWAVEPATDIETAGTVVYQVDPAMTHSLFFPTEIIFVCDAYSATTKPTISVGATIGGTPNHTALVNSQSLTGITGGGQAMRFDVPNPVGVKDLFFKLDTRASGGTCRGRFLWKGYFIECPQP